MQRELCQWFFVFSNSERRGQLEHKVGPAEEECCNAHRLDAVTLLHVCFTELFYALDHSYNAFALAQVASLN